VQRKNLSNLKKQFGLRVRQIRDEAQRTQEEFAEILGISVDFLSLIERGRNAPSFKKLEKMARGVGKPVAYLFTFDPSYKPRKRNAHR
jgi:transcriptional regulator with XRE-family HTH domain